MSPKFSPKQKADTFVNACIVLVPFIALVTISWLTPLTWPWVFGGFFVIVGGIAARRKLRDHQKKTIDKQPIAETVPSLVSLDDTSEIPVVPPIRSSYPRDVPPPPYNRIRHWKFFSKEVMWGRDIVMRTAAIAAAPVAILVVLARPQLSSISLTTAIGVVVPAVALAYGFLVLRSRDKWQVRPLSYSPEDGVLKVGQAGSRRWFFRGSSPDTYPLDNVKLRTPDQTWWETYVPWFRNSQTLQLITVDAEGEKVILELRDVVNVEEILAIQAYRNSVHQVDNELTRQLLEETRIANDQRAKLIALQEAANNE